MTATIRIPTPLRTATAGASVVEVRQPLLDRREVLDQPIAADGPFPL